MKEKRAIQKSPRVVLVLGGARSGKSRYARILGEAFDGRRLFVATAQALDDEMTQRVENHKRERGDLWETLEEPTEIISAIIDGQKRHDVILIDCLTLWLSNLLMAHGDDHEKIESDVQELVGCLEHTRTPVILVSNEVGLSIVPDNRLGRVFRDLAGRLNQRIARVADRVVFMVAGIPTDIKGRA
jgi:adenosyl cobinamide kinase/adenosyl cobinamide phosphate guanylyltransferase